MSEIKSTAKLTAQAEVYHNGVKVGPETDAQRASSIIDYILDVAGQEAEKQDAE